MKKGARFLLSMLMLCAVSLSAGCPGKQGELERDAKAVHRSGMGKRIVTSFYPMYIMTINVTKGIGEVRVSNLTPPIIGCLHDYSPTTAEMKKLDNADIFVTNGAGMESFLDKVARQNPRIVIVRLAEGIPLLKGAQGENPHVWVSISHAISEVENLKKALISLDPVHAGAYKQNADAYISRLAALRSEMVRELAPYRGARIITFHEAFPYFAREFGLIIAAVVEREPGSAPNARELAESIDSIKKKEVKALFSEPQYPASAADAIARETGMKIYVLDPAVTGPDDPDAYIRIMGQNLKTLQEALK